jgi:transcriptional regulator GlxA family with amidase domain
MQFAIGLYPGFTALDAIGPYQVLTNVPGAQTVLCAASAGPIADDMGLLRLDIEHTFDEVAAPDVLIVPGGLVTRKLAADGDPIVEWVRAAHEHTTWTTSVCVGALVLGAAGILRGLRATTHWIAYDELTGYGAEPTEERVVIEGKVATAAGVSAGIDLALTLVGQIWGPELAQSIQLGIEYDPQPPFDAGAPSKAPEPIHELVAATLSAAMDVAESRHGAAITSPS